MKEEEPVDGKKSEDDGIEKENLAILEKIRKNQRQDHLNVSGSSMFKLIIIPPNYQTAFILLDLSFSLVSRLPDMVSVGVSLFITGRVQNADSSFLSVLTVRQRDAGGPG